MSDLAATNCGCGCDTGCDGGCGGNNGLFSTGNGCCSMIWILLLLSCCWSGGFGFGRGGNDNCLWIILLLCCCGGCN